jgi:hypothetical protein
MAFPTRSPETLEQIRRAYELGCLTARTVARTFGLASGGLFALVRCHGWAARSEGLYAPGTTARDRAIAVRAAEAAREVELYGDAIADVRLLGQRGFVVVREGARCRVGNSLCTIAEMRAKAGCERRVLEAANSMPAVRHPPEHRAAG